MTRFPRPFTNPCELPSRSASAAAVLFAILAMAGCGGGGSNGGGGGNGGGGTPSFNLAITPSLPVLAVGDTQQFTATPVDPTTGNPVAVSGLTFSWTSSDTAVATIDMKSGLATLVGVGTTTIEVMATNSSGNGAGNQVTMLKVANPLMVNPGPLPLGALTIPYITTGLGSGGAAPVTWSLMNGTTLPAGLTLNSNGSVSGTPTAAGVSPNFMVQVTDSETPPVSKQATFSITTVDPTNPCSLLTSTNPAMLNGSYAFLLQGFQATTANGTPLAIAGSFAANGSGGVTGGELDLNVAAGPQHLTINGGAYAVNASGQGCLQLKYVRRRIECVPLRAQPVAQCGQHSHARKNDRIRWIQGRAGRLLYQSGFRQFCSCKTPRSFPTPVSPRALHLARTDSICPASTWPSADPSIFNNANGNLTNFAEDFNDGGTISTVTGATGAVDFHRDNRDHRARNSCRHVARPHNCSCRGLHRQCQRNVAHFHGPSQRIDLRFTAAGPSSRAVPTRQIRFPETTSTAPKALTSRAMALTCAASGPCALTDVAILNANPGSGALTGTLYKLQAGATQHQHDHEHDLFRQLILRTRSTVFVRWRNIARLLPRCPGNCGNRCH